MSEEFMF